MTRPCRRITLHLSQIFLTLGLTFTVRLLLLLVPVDDATAGQVVRRELYDDSVFRKDADVVLAHLAADVRQDPVTVGELDAEHGVRQWLDNAPLDLDGAFLLRHVLRSPVCVRGRAAAQAGRQAGLRQRAPTLKTRTAGREQPQPAAFSAPSAARRSLPPSSAVSTHGPSSVSVNVCSKWADGAPSWVTTVQPSSSTSVWRPPRLTIGST